MEKYGTCVLPQGVWEDPCFFLFIRVAIDGDYGYLSSCLSIFEGLQ